jgi:hypothetical protein
VTTRDNRGRRRIAISLVVVAAALAVITLVVPNVLLQSDFIRKRINRDPNSGWLDYDSAVSRWPGALHVKNFRLRDRDSKAEWALQLDDANVTYSLADLLRKRFHVTRLSGRGFAFRARNRLTPAQATPLRLSRIPRIPGFPDPPVIGPSKPKPPPTGKEWSIQIDRVAVDEAREIWIDEYRYDGQARVTGGFFLRPKHRAEVFRGKLSARRGTLRSGREVIAADVRATIDARIAPWNPREYPGSKMLRFVFGDAEASGRLDNAEIVNRLIGEPPGTRFERGSGRMSVHGSVEEGVAKATIDYASRDLALRVLDVAMRGRFDGRMQLSRVRMETWGGGRLNGGHVKLSDATLSERDGKPHPWWGRIDFSPGGFRPKSVALFTTNASARARDAQPLLQILSVNLPEWTERLLELDEELVARAAVRVGKSLAELHRLAARAGKAEIYGEYVARGSSRSGTFLVDAGLLSVGVALSGREKKVRIFGARKWFRERTGWEPQKD